MDQVFECYSVQSRDYISNAFNSSVIARVFIYLFFYLCMIGSWESMVQFLDIGYAVHTTPREEDKVTWLTGTSRGFQVKIYNKA